MKSLVWRDGFPHSPAIVHTPSAQSSCVFHRVRQTAFVLLKWFVQVLLCVTVEQLTAFRVKTTYYPSSSNETLLQ
jgi:hypothetical protein